MLALAIWTTHARAQSDCQATFEAELTRLRGPAALVEGQGYRTYFEADGAELHATIRAEDGSTRELRAPGPSCQSLATATAVALALMLDASPPYQPPPRAFAPPYQAPPPKIPKRQRTLTAGAGMGILLGTPRELAPALLGELGLRLPHARIALGVLWSTPKRETFTPGDIRSELSAGELRVCFTPWSHLSLCSGAYLGQRSMRARGYTRNEDERSLWGAAPIEVALDYTWAHVGAELGLAALLPFQRKRFAIDGLGTVREDWPVQALFALRVFGMKNL